MIIRAISLGLIQASINQVESSVLVSYVKPRVLNKDQIVALKGQVDAWGKRAGETQKRLEEGVPPEIFT